MSSNEPNSFIFGPPRPNNNARITYINQLAADAEIFEVLQQRSIGTVRPGQTLRLQTTAGRTLIAATNTFQQVDRPRRDDTIILRSTRANDENAIFIFPFQLSVGGGSNSVVRGFIDDPVSIDLGGPVTFMAWLRSTDITDWRTFISIESQDCKTSLINVALQPGTMRIYFAYMVNTGGRIDVSTDAIAPGPNAYFHIALTLSNGNVTIYLDGKKQSSHTIGKNSIFNPESKRVVIGRTKYENSGTAQWNGQISDVKVFGCHLNDEDVMKEFQENRR
ncbi:hypothetical protein AX17_002764 [Amanita inopinata Kibby_2008]|nr:hypothetical protein AX17_002764 [Amanita inopinata Kibby_2008]